MTTIVLLLSIFSWDAKVALADAIVTVAQDVPKLPDDIKKPTGQVADEQKPSTKLNTPTPLPDERLEPLEPVRPKLIKFKDEQIIVIEMLARDDCAPCHKAEREIGLAKWGRRVVFNVRNSTTTTVPFFTIWVNGRLWTIEGYKGIQEFQSQLQAAENAK